MGTFQINDKPEKTSALNTDELLIENSAGSLFRISAPNLKKIISGVTDNLISIDASDQPVDSGVAIANVVQNTTGSASATNEVLVSAGANKTAKASGVNYEVMNSKTAKNWIIDSDFMMNQNEVTSYVSHGSGYITDIWGVDVNGNIDVTVTPEYDSDIKNNKILCEDLTTQFYIHNNQWDVSKLENKNISVIFKVSSTSGGSILFAEINQNFGSGGSTAVGVASSSSRTISASTSEEWYRLDVVVPTISGKTIGANSYIEIRITQSNSLSAGSDLTFHSVKCFETQFLPSDEDIIPEWCKQSEQYEEVEPKVLQYYEVLWADTAYAGFGCGSFPNTTNYYVYFSFEQKLKVPTYTVSGTFDVIDSSGSHTIGSFGTMRARRSSAYIGTNVTAAPTGEAGVMRAANDTSAYIELRARP